MEGCKAAMVTSSGMAAISSTLLTLLKSGDHMLVQESLYGGTEMLLTHDLPDWGITVTRVNADKPDTWRQQLKPNTKVAPARDIAWHCVRSDHDHRVTRYVKDKMCCAAFMFVQLPAFDSAWYRP